MVLTFTPSVFVIYTSSIFISYNYNMWDILPIQLTFFMTLFILIFYT
jgi:hypothetical protein